MTKSATVRKIEEEPEMLSAANDNEILAETKEKPSEATEETVDSHLVLRETDSEMFGLQREIAKSSTLFRDAEKLARESEIDVSEKGWEGKLARRLEKVKHKLAFVKKGEESTESLRSSFEEAVDEFGEANEMGHYRAKKVNFENVKNLLAKNWEKTEGEFFLLRPFLFLKSLVADSLKWKGVQRYEKEIGFYKKAQEKGGALKDSVENFSEKVGEGVETAKKARETLAHNPAAIESVRILRAKYKEKMHQITMDARTGKISPKKAAEKIKNLTASIAKDGIKKGKMEFYTQVKRKKFPGLTLKTTGKLMAIEVLSRGIWEAVAQGDFGVFPETITDSNVLVEAVPIVGSFKSGWRLFQDNGDPLWAKWADFGLNLTGDAIFVVGAIGSLATFGATGAAGIATRVGVVTAGREAIKSAVTKQALKETVKTSVKTVGKYSLYSLAIQTALEKAFPEGKITKVATDVVLSRLSPGQRQLLEIGGTTF